MKKTIFISALLSLYMNSALALVVVPCKKDFDETLKSVTKVQELKQFNSNKRPYGLYEMSFNEDGLLRAEYILIENSSDPKKCRIVIRDQSLLSYRSGMSPDLMPTDVAQVVIEDAALIQARHEAGIGRVSRESYLKNLERMDPKDANIKWLVSKLRVEWSLK
ncbi:MAG: hypothetical protein KA116_01490 [Proteobacteria bacterium]|nr:hypothetical protein [Pseudomonadota bacterium]